MTKVKLRVIHNPSNKPLQFPAEKVEVISLGYEAGPDDTSVDDIDPERVREMMTAWARNNGRAVAGYEILELVG